MPAKAAHRMAVNRLHIRLAHPIDEPQWVVLDRIQGHWPRPLTATRLGVGMANGAQSLGLSKSATASIRVRKSVTALSAGEVAILQSALTKMMAISDDRGYQYWAGIHGLPLPISCTHGTPLFLPWHRAYLYYFEQYMIDQEPTVTLPWWDWSTQQGIPQIYADSSATNPLNGSPITGIPDSQFAGQRISPVADTFRVPADPTALPTAAHVTWLISLETFADFTQQVEQTHNNVHAWVGGTMDEIPVAAFDPIFWAHHTMIDRIWALWQQKHPGAGTGGLVPVDQPLGPFPTLNVGQTFDIATLGYEYAASTSTGRP